MKANYDSISEAWCNARKALPPKDHALFNLFIKMLPSKGKVLDMGCGSGHPITTQLTNAGFSVHGIDRSKKLLREASINAPAASFEKVEIEEYEIIEQHDGIVLWDSLFHIQREEHAQILKKIHTSLVQNGLLILSSGGTEEEIPPFTDFMFGTEFFYDSFSPGKLLTLLKTTGFKVEHYVVLNEPDGKRGKGRIGVILSKA